MSTTDTVPSRFRDTVRAHGPQPALQHKVGDGFEQLTWDDYADLACRAAAGFASLGVGRGDRVLLLMTNRPEFHWVDVGAVLAGATPISAYNSSSPEQIAYLARHARAKVAVVESGDLFSRVLKVRDELEDLAHVVVVDGDETETSDDGLHPLSVLSGADPVDLDEAAAAADPDDLLTVIYTSGTTGPPKGVKLSHANVVAEADLLFDQVVQRDPAGWRMLSYLPMAHIAERVSSHYSGPLKGTFVTTVADPTQVAAYAREVHPEAMFGPPRIWEKMKAGVEAAVAARGEEAAAGFAKALDLGTRVDAMRLAGQEVPAEMDQALQGADAQAFAPLRQMLGLHEAVYLLSGAAPIPKEVLHFFRGIGLPMSECWGMSETTGALTWSHWDYRLGAVGRAAEGMEVRIAEDGELLCRGPVVTSGYLDDPERTAEAFDDEGWFRTGDIAELDDDGYLWIRDRKKELIITASGKNVAPAVIEAELKTISLVGQACVVGDGRRYLVALLVLDPDAAPGWAQSQGISGSLEELATHDQVREEVDRQVREVNQQFNNVEQIKRFTLLGEEWLPDTEVLTPTMKLKRRGVLERYAAEIEALYAG